jgi:hypothetical protein
METHNSNPVTVTALRIGQAEDNHLMRLHDSVLGPIGNIRIAEKNTVRAAPSPLWQKGCTRDVPIGNIRAANKNTVRAAPSPLGERG